MDLYCKRCGEPYDYYHIEHDIDPFERGQFYRGEGCQSCKGKEVTKRPFRAMAMEALHEVLGDDIDGLAAELDDAEYLMGPKFWAEEE
jgi:hypothetical protein